MERQEFITITMNKIAVGQGEETVESAESVPQKEKTIKRRNGKNKRIVLKKNRDSFRIPPTTYLVPMRIVEPEVPEWRRIPNDRKFGDLPAGELHKEELLKKAAIIEELKMALSTMVDEDPIAGLPFVWKLPDLKDWLDKRRRKADPEFASRRPRITPIDKRRLLKWSSFEWDTMASSPYVVGPPKKPEKLRRNNYNMSHYKMLRDEAEKLRNEYFGRFRRTVIEEARDFWPTTCPPLPDPLPWRGRKKPGRPPHPDPPPNFRKVFHAYLPVREKDIIL